MPETTKEALKRAATRGASLFHSPDKDEAESNFKINLKLPRNQPSMTLGHSAVNQRSRILQPLWHVGSLTTLQARYKLDILYPGMRVKNLRNDGYAIEMIWVEDITPEGNFHRVGQYLLMPSKQLLLPGFEQVKGGGA